MATIKAYTSLEQSKKLGQILPLKLESADMTWKREINKISKEIEWIPTIGLDVAIKDNLFSFRNGYVFPCWSLAALLSVLPYSSLHKTYSGWRCDTYDKEGNSCQIGEDTDNPVDACYEMILKLHEQNIL